MTCTTFRKSSECTSRIGYEIKFNQEFFEHQPPRSLVVINMELDAIKKILGMLREITK